MLLSVLFLLLEKKHKKTSSVVYHLIEKTLPEAQQRHKELSNTVLGINFEVKEYKVKSSIFKKEFITI